MISSCSARRCVTSAMRLASATAALSALTLFSRPTWSGTIISGKITVSRRATSGSSRIGAGGRPAVAFDFGIWLSWASGPAGLRVLAAARVVRPVVGFGGRLSGCAGSRPG